MQAVDGGDSSHRQQQLSHRVDVDVLRSACGEKHKADARCHERTTCSQRKGYFHDKHPVFTFHQYSEDVLCDGKCRSNDEHREQERANRICYFIFRL